MKPVDVFIAVVGDPSQVFCVYILYILCKSFLTTSPMRFCAYVALLYFFQWCGSRLQMQCHSFMFVCVVSFWESVDGRKLGEGEER